MSEKLCESLVPSQGCPSSHSERSDTQRPATDHSEGYSTALPTQETGSSQRAPWPQAAKQHLEVAAGSNLECSFDACYLSPWLLQPDREMHVSVSQSQVTGKGSLLLGEGLITDRSGWVMSPGSSCRSDCTL